MLLADMSYSVYHTQNFLCSISHLTASRSTDTAGRRYNSAYYKFKDNNHTHVKHNFVLNL